MALTLTSTNIFKQIASITITRLTGGVPNIMGVSIGQSCSLPAAQPTALTFTPGTSIINGSFTAATPAANQYLVVRYPSGATPTVPVNGTVYTAGGTLGLGTVVQSAATTSFSATGLVPATAYDFYVYAFNSTSCFGPVYNVTGPLTGTQNTSTCANLSGIIPVGPTGTYATLADAFTGLANGISGPVVLELQSTYAGEATPITIGFNPCFSLTKTVTIRPALGANLVITGANAGPSVDFNGAKFVTIDGRPGGTGTISGLTIINTSTTGAAVRFTNDAQNDALTYVDLQGQNTATSTTLSGVVFFGGAGTTGQGNDNNFITFCSVHGTAGGTPAIGIHAVGTTTTIASYNDNNRISNCNIYDYFQPGIATSGLKLDVGNSTWIISSNSFYQTASRAYSATLTQRAVWVTPNTGNITNTANGFTITNNYVGGNAPNAISGSGNAPGTAAVMTITGTVSTIFNAFDISVGTGAVTSVQNNVMANMDISTSTGGFVGIGVANGSVDVGTVTGNTVGASTGVSSIVVTTTAIGGGTVIGYRTNGGTNNTINIANNIFGAVRTAGSATLGVNINGISVAGGTTVNVTNNIIGSTTTTNSVQASAVTTGNTQSVIGINVTGSTTVVLSGNTIANLHNAYVGTGTGVAKGINVTTSNCSILNNIIYLISTESPQAGGGASAALGGISTTTTTTGINVSGNTIHSLRLLSTSTTASIAVTGIFFSGSTTVQSFITKNNIHSFELTAANTNVTITGIDYSTGTSTFANNIIRLGIRPDGTSLATEVVLRGISSNSSSVLNNFYFNTIYIGGTGVGTTARNSYAFTRTSTSGTYDLRNNIFVNSRSNTAAGGKHYAVFFTTAFTGVTADYNLYRYNGTGGLFSINGAVDVAAYSSGWIASDVHSLVGDPLFVSPNGTSATGNLHLTTGTPAESTGVPIASVTDDIDGEIRSNLTPTDIGADAGNYGVTGVDVGVVSLVAPAIGSCYGSSETVTVALKNYSLTALNFSVNPVTVSVFIPTGTGSPYTSNIVISTGTLAAGATMNVTVPTTLNMSALGTYTFQANATAAADANAANNAMAPESRVVTAGASLNGTYTVGTSGNYPTLTAAVAAYNTAACATGNVVFSLTDATYSTLETFPIVIDRPGSGTNTLTIRPAAGTAVTITGSTGAALAGLIRLNGADNVTIDGINTGGASLLIENTSTTSGAAVIWLSANGTNGASGNVIRNTTIKAGVAQNNSTTTTYGLVIAGGTLSGTITAITAGDDNDNNIIESNTFIKVRYAIYTRGGSTLNPNLGTIIRKNIVGPAAFGVDEIGKNGIIVREEDGIQITGNEIRFVGGDFANATTGADRAGISFSTTGDWTPPTVYVKNAVVTGNLVHDIVEERTFSAVGIAVAGVDGLNLVNNLVANNMIWNIKADGTAGDQAIGIGISAGNGNRVVYNTIYMTGDTDPNAAATTTAVSAFGISVSATAATNLELKDNLVYMDLSSSSAPTLRNAAINIPTGFVWGTGGSDFNDVYILGTNTQSNIGTIGGSGGTYYATLAAWQAASGQDLNSISVAPVFVGANDLHLITGLNIALNNKGTALSYINTDIDNDTRNPSTPDMGADEFVVPLGVDILASTLVSPVVKSCYSTAEQVQISIRNLSSNTLTFSATPVTVTVNVTGATTATLSTIVNTGTLASGDSLIVTLPLPLNMSVTGTYTFNATATTPSDVNLANDAMVPVSRTALAVTAGTINSAQSTICISGVPVLSLTGNAGGNIQWQEATTLAGPYTNVGTNSTSYTPAAAITGNMYYQAVLSCNASTATTTPFLVTVNNPQVLTSVPGQRCGPGTVTLTATASAGATSTGIVLQLAERLWAQAPALSTPILNTTTTYYVSSEIGTTVCASVRTPVIATVNAGPAFTTTQQNLTVCNNGIKQLSVTSPLANFTSYTWSPNANLFTDATAATAYTGTNVSTLYFRSSVAGIYTVYINALNTTTGCTGIDSIKVTVMPGGASLTASIPQICVSGATTITLNPSTGFGAGSLQWFSSPDATNYTILTGITGNNFTTPVLTSATSYRVDIKDAAGTVCQQPVITVTVNNPQVLTSVSNASCGTGTMTLSATGSAGTS
jgi:hypothetical protein